MRSRGAREPASDPRVVCGRARRCPGWFVSEEGYVRRCGSCRALAGDDQARESALAAGLDVQRSGYVAGASGVGDARREYRSEDHRVAVSVNDALVRVLEQLRDVQRTPCLPDALRGCIDHLTIEVARVQGVSEWVSEGLVRLVGDVDGQATG